MIKKASEITLKVRPIALTIEHRYYYEGPCRFGQGEALQPGFDRLLNSQIAEEFMGYLKSSAPAGVELLELVSIGRSLQPLSLRLSGPSTRSGRSIPRSTGPRQATCSPP